MVSLKHVLDTLFGVKGGNPKVPVGRGGRSDGVGIGVASYVAVMDGKVFGSLVDVSGYELQNGGWVEERHTYIHYHVRVYNAWT